MSNSKRSWLTWLSEVYTGWTREPQRGGCAGDPQYWEREIQQRASRDAAEAASSPRQIKTGEAPGE